MNKFGFVSGYLYFVIMIAKLKLLAFMKFILKSIFIVVSALGLVSCQEKDNSSDEASVIKVENKLLKFDSEGGECVIPYTSIGNAYGKLVDVDVDAEWVELENITSTSVELSIGKNDTGVDRTAKVVISGYEAPEVIVRIVQSKVSDSTPAYSNFTVTISDITSSSACIEVDPLNPSAYYYTDLLTASLYESYGESKIVENMLDYITQMVPISGATDPRVFLYQGYYNTSYDENVSLDLRDNTDYYVAVVGMDVDEEGNLVTTGKGEFYKFRTLKASPVDMDFSFAISGSQVEVTPSDDYTYVCGVASKSQWDAYSDHADVARDYIAIAKQYGMLETIIYSGKRLVDFTYLLEKSGEYVVYAVGYRNSEKDKGITTEISFNEFTYTVQ